MRTYTDNNGGEVISMKHSLSLSNYKQRLKKITEAAVVLTIVAFPVLEPAQAKPSIMKTCPPWGCGSGTSQSAPGIDINNFYLSPFVKDKDSNNQVGYFPEAIENLKIVTREKCQEGVIYPKGNPCKGPEVPNGDITRTLTFSVGNLKASKINNQTRTQALLIGDERDPNASDFKNGGVKYEVTFQGPAKMTFFVDGVNKEETFNADSTKLTFFVPLPKGATGESPTSLINSLSGLRTVLSKLERNQQDDLVVQGLVSLENSPINNRPLKQSYGLGGGSELIELEGIPKSFFKELPLKNKSF